MALRCQHPRGPMMDAPVLASAGYRGRIAPSPTGYLHLGHARTFWIAQDRARADHGVLVLRNEDRDLDRCRPEFAAAMLEDLAWFGLDWQEGPDRGGQRDLMSRVGVWPSMPRPCPGCRRKAWFIPAT